MTDRIEIKGLLVRAIVGVNDEERENRQDVIISLTLETDTRPAAASDEIADAVNYRTITKQVIDLAENSRFFLVERLAEEIAKLCLADLRVERVRVTVEKPDALRFVQTVGVTIERERADA